MDLVKLDVHHGPKVKPENTEEPTTYYPYQEIWSLATQNEPKYARRRAYEWILFQQSSYRVLKFPSKGSDQQQQKTHSLPYLVEGKHYKE